MVHGFVLIFFNKISLVASCYLFIGLISKLKIFFLLARYSFSPESQVLIGIQKDLNLRVSEIAVMAINDVFATGINFVKCFSDAMQINI